MDLRCGSKLKRVMIQVLLCVAIINLCDASVASYHVSAVTGVDTSTCGGSDTPCHSIGYVLNATASAGQPITVIVSPGTYEAQNNTMLMVEDRMVTVVGVHNETAAPAILCAGEVGFVVRRALSATGLSMDQCEVAVFAELGDVSLYDMVFTNSTDIAVSMNGLSLRAFRCVFLNGSSSAIAALGSKMTISGCVFTNNTAFLQTAGVNANGCDVLIDDSQFLSNNGQTTGGAVSAFAGTNMTIDRSVFHGNDATWGGGIYLADGSALNVNSSSFIDNSATLGSCLFTYLDGQAMLSNVTFVSNGSSNIYLRSTSQVEIADSVVQLSRALSSAVMSTDSTRAIVRNSACSVVNVPEARCVRTRSEGIVGVVGESNF